MTAEANGNSVRKVSETKLIGKGDARYWKQDGKLLTDPRSPFFSCKIQVGGRRESFPLRIANKEKAASKAAAIFNDVVALGWEVALAKHKPKASKDPKSATIGALIEEVRATAGFRQSTFATYAGSLRQIAAGIADIGD